MSLAAGGLLVVCALTAGPAWAQCAMCKTALTGSPEGRAVAQELNRAILVMFVSPYLVSGSFLLALFRRQIAVRLATVVAALAARLRVNVSLFARTHPRPDGLSR